MASERGAGLSQEFDSLRSRVWNEERARVASVEVGLLYEKYGFADPSVYKDGKRRKWMNLYWNVSYRPSVVYFRKDRLGAVDEVGREEVVWRFRREVAQLCELDRIYAEAGFRSMDAKDLREVEIAALSGFNGCGI